jgi:hypothetical protein
MRNGSYNGVVVKLTDQHIVLLCTDGHFKNIPRQGQVPKIGQRYTHVEKKSMIASHPWVKFTAAAAVLLIIALWTMPFGSNQPIYMVALDINPSIEIYADQDFNVTRMNALNLEAEQLLDEINMKQLKLTAALTKLVELSIEKGYLDQHTSNRLVAISLIPLKENINQEAVIDFELTHIQATIEGLLLTYGVHAEIIMNKETKAFAEKAKELNLSVHQHRILNPDNGSPVQGILPGVIPQLPSVEQPSDILPEIVIPDVSSDVRPVVPLPETAPPEGGVILDLSPVAPALPDIRTPPLQKRSVH